MHNCEGGIAPLKQETVNSRILIQTNHQKYFTVLLLLQVVFLVMETAFIAVAFTDTECNPDYYAKSI